MTYALARCRRHDCDSKSTQRSIDNRRQKCTGWLVVEPHAHQRHGLIDAESVRQAPAEQLAVARGHYQAGTDESRRLSNQRFYIVIALADRMTEKTDHGCVTGNLAGVLDQRGRSLFDCLQELRGAVVAMDSDTERVASLEVTRVCLAHGVTRNLHADRRTLQVRQRLARVESQFCVQRQRAVMISRLH